MMRGFLTARVSLDATATAFMRAGSRSIPLTFHGVLGYSAFLLMSTDLVLMWRRCRLKPIDPLPAKLHRYSLAAYSCGFWRSLQASPVNAFQLHEEAGVVDNIIRRYQFAAIHTRHSFNFRRAFRIGRDTMGFDACNGNTSRPRRGIPEQPGQEF